MLAVGLRFENPTKATQSTGVKRFGVTATASQSLKFCVEITVRFEHGKRGTPARAVIPRW